MKAILCLEDGTYFIGKSFGKTGECFGEVVFNTAITGYQEIITDPSYKGQIVVMTNPQIGNYGVNNNDVESDSPKVAGFVVREISKIDSNHTSIDTLSSYLEKHNIVGISNIDTRALVKILRERGVTRGFISTIDLKPKVIYEKVKMVKDISSLDLVSEVTTDKIYTIHAYKSSKHFVLVDFGVKQSIIRYLVENDITCTVVPANIPKEDIEAMNPDAVFLSNGPGDPANVLNGIAIAKHFFGKKPVFGICLGHQIMSLAIGAKTYKLKFGHHGANHPVKDMRNNRVVITSQNHNYAVEDLPDFMEVTHINLLDNTIEGMIHKNIPYYSVQFHPEASPGPHDALYIFKEFKDMA